MPTSPTATEVHQAIEQITSHELFNKSPLRCAFLRYVVSETLAGRESRIKAYSVAVDALKMEPTFNPQENPCVRVLAKRLRDSLNSYYQITNEYNVLVTMIPGSYVPTFEKINYRWGSLSVSSHLNKICLVNDV